jgi:large subunit ribosomal protein L9
MEVILNQDVEHVGRKDELVEVSDGYGRNYLIPQGLAEVADESKKKAREEEIKQKEHKLKKQKEEAEKMAKKLEDQVIEVGAKAGKEKKLFGTITALQLADAIKDQAKIEVERKFIDIREEVRYLGTYKARVELFKDVEAEVTFEVVKE